MEICVRPQRSPRPKQNQIYHFWARCKHNQLVSTSTQSQKLHYSGAFLYEPTEKTIYTHTIHMVEKYCSLNKVPISS